MSNKISFFQTVIWDSNFLVAKVANFCEGGLNVSGKVYQVIPSQNGQNEKVSEIYEKIPRRVTGLKVLPYATLVIPVLFGIGKVISRAKYSFTVKKKEELENNELFKKTELISNALSNNPSNLEKTTILGKSAHNRRFYPFFHIAKVAVNKLISLEFENITSTSLDDIVGEGFRISDDLEAPVLYENFCPRIGKQVKVKTEENKIFSVSDFFEKMSRAAFGSSQEIKYPFAIVSSHVCVIRKEENESWVFYIRCEDRGNGAEKRPCLERFLSQKEFLKGLEKKLGGWEISRAFIIY